MELNFSFKGKFEMFMLKFSINAQETPSVWNDGQTDSDHVCGRKCGHKQQAHERLELGTETQGKWRNRRTSEASRHESARCECKWVRRAVMGKWLPTISEWRECEAAKVMGAKKKKSS